jgi:hypothetical protein
VSTALATETAFAAGRSHEHSATRLFESSGSTLEDIVLGAWEDLAARGSAECPVCAGELEVGGCLTCGSELS